MSLPIIQNGDSNLLSVQTQWATQLNPLLAQPLSQAVILSRVTLASGANMVNHKLGRTLQGWIIVRQRSAATFFDTQDSNASPQLTLQLTASAVVVVDLLVF